MFLADPPRTPFDLNFRVFDVPVRVHPMFWLVAVLLGTNADTQAAEALLWVAVVFVSILAHELGHVLAFRYYGVSSHVVLYSFGGLAVPNGPVRLRAKADIVVSFAGPLAGFVVAGLMILGLKLAGVQVLLRFGLPDLVDWRFGGDAAGVSRNLLLFAHYMLFANIFWGLVNLLPIWPLDGGRIARSAFELSDARDGLRKSLIVSIVAAGLMAVYGLRSDAIFTTVFFAYMAFQSYQDLQRLGGRFGSPW